MAGVLGGQKGALMMVEPPGELWIAGVLEVDDGVLLAVEEAVLEDLGGPVRHAGVVEIGGGVERTAVKAAEKCRGGGAVETVIVVEDAYPHAFRG